jgi:hypothetical protein
MAPAEFGWAPLSEPLVDVIATLDNLLSRRLITSAQRDLIADRARGLHFTERTEEALFAGQGDDTGLRDLYQAHRFSQKRADAEELVRALQSLSAANVETPRFTLSRSPFWVGPTA